MKVSRRFRALGRTAGVVTGVIIVTSGITFAALQSQQVKLTGNTIETATANLQISADGINYGATQNGFDFSNIVPGGQAVPQNGYNVYLKNGGQTALGLKLAVSSTPSNPGGIDLSKVNVILTPVGSGSPQTFNLQTLITSNATGGTSITTPSEVFAGNTTHFTVQVSMTTDAINSSSASLGNLDFAFSGVALSN